MLAAVEGVRVALCDAPGFGRGYEDEEYLQPVTALLRGGKIDIVILCCNMTEVRLRKSFVHLLQEHDKAGVNWERTVITLTFADWFPVPAHLRETNPSYSISA